VPSPFGDSTRCGTRPIWEMTEYKENRATCPEVDLLVLHLWALRNRIRLHHAESRAGL
jgi:hypothetical protein